MPDPYGFNHLGDTVRCIDCPTGGPIGSWPEHKRAAHARTEHDRTSADVRRLRSLLAVPPTDSNEEKEATTMATTTPKSGKGEPAKQVAIDIMREAGEPLHANEIAKRIIASGRCAGLKGETPEATISAMLAVGSKPGGPFKRVDKGTYTLADAPAITSKPAQAPSEKSAAVKKPAQTRKRASAPKPKRAAKRRTAAKRSA